jgi:hypothetical protein
MLVESQVPVRAATEKARVAKYVQAGIVPFKEQRLVA